jgi:DNA-binding response OmpR family regulator
MSGSEGLPVVVCVDDEPAVLSALQRLLRMEPYQLLTTDRPREALAWILERKADLVIADQRMPSMTGLELLEEVRSRSPSTVRVMLSANTGLTRIMNRAEIPTIERIVRKPWDGDELKIALRELLSRKERPVAIESPSVDVQAGRNAAHYRVLLVGSEESVPQLPALLEHDSEQRVRAEAMTAVQQALERISEKGYDAVVCWADREDELAGVIRIREASPELPILLLTSRTDPNFEGLARQMGATLVAWKHQDLAVTSECIRLALSTGELAREAKVRFEEARSQTREIGVLAGTSRQLARATSNELTRRVRTPHFVPLVVEDALDDALLMIRAFAKAGVLTALPILRSAEEAIAYLSQVSLPGGRRLLNTPSVAILDIRLPGRSGFDVLEWVRKQSMLKHLPVVMLTSSANPQDMEKAYRLGANSYLVKPTNFEGLVEVVSTLRDFWGTLNESSDTHQ